HLLCQLDPTFGDQLEIASLDCIILGLPGSLSRLDCPSSILLCPCVHDGRQCEAGNSPAKSVVGHGAAVGRLYSKLNTQECGQNAAAHVGTKQLQPNALPPSND